MQRENSLLQCYCCAALHSFGKSAHFTHLYLRNYLLSLSLVSWVFWKIKALNFTHSTRLVAEISDLYAPGVKGK